MKKKIRCLLYVLCYATGIFLQPQEAQSYNYYTTAPYPVYASDGTVVSPSPPYPTQVIVPGAYPPSAYYPQAAPAAYGYAAPPPAAYPPLPQTFSYTPPVGGVPQPPVLLQAPMPPPVYAPTPPVSLSPPVIQSVQSTPPSVAPLLSTIPPLPALLPPSGTPTPPADPIQPNILSHSPPILKTLPILPLAKTNSPPKVASKPLKKKAKKSVPLIKERPPIPDTPQSRAEAALYEEPIQAFCKNGKVAGMAAIRHASKLKRSPGPIAVTYSLTPPKKGEGLQGLNRHCTDQKSELDLDRLNGMLKKYGYLTGTPKQAALSKKKGKNQK